MSNKKETRPSAATPERDMEKNVSGMMQNLSKTDFIMSKPPCQSGRVSKLLLTGKENAIAGKDLVELLGLNDIRDLTQMIERERKAGIPICAGTSQECKGYYLASGSEELEQYIKSLNRRLHNMGATLTHLEDAYLRMTGQERIGGWV